MLLLFARVNRAREVRDRPYVPTGFFGVGYLTVWGGFSALATGLQWGLEELDLLGPMMTATNYCLAVRSARGRLLATDPAQGRLPAPLPLAVELSYPAQMPLVRYYSALFQDQLQVPYIRDVLERIGGDHNQVGELARLHRA
jgi:hypothetical protein